MLEIRWQEHEGCTQTERRGDIPDHPIRRAHVKLINVNMRELLAVLEHQHTSS